LSKKYSIHGDHRLVLGEGADCKIMFEYAFGVGYEGVVDSNQVVAVLPYCLRWIDCAVECVLQEAVLPESYDFKGEADEEEEDGDD
jgi:hypothetical protein